MFAHPNLALVPGEQKGGAEQLHHPAPFNLAASSERLVHRGGKQPAQGHIASKGKSRNHWPSPTLGGGPRLGHAGGSQPRWKGLGLPGLLSTFLLHHLLPPPTHSLVPHTCPRAQDWEVGASDSQLQPQPYLYLWLQPVERLRAPTHPSKVTWVYFCFCLFLEMLMGFQKCRASHTSGQHPSLGASILLPILPHSTPPSSPTPPLPGQ